MVVVVPATVAAAAAAVVVPVLVVPVLVVVVVVVVVAVAVVTVLLTERGEGWEEAEVGTEPKVLLANVEHSHHRRLDHVAEFSARAPPERRASDCKWYFLLPCASVQIRAYVPKPVLTASSIWMHAQ